MKKIININLSGRVIPIEDSAYEKLQAYIESLRRYFANEEGRDEIINDIESRIAELMSEKVRKGASSITDDDVNEIITSMGRVEDFEAEEKENAASSAAASSSTSSSSQQRAEPNFTTSATNKKSRGRLYRDSNDKFIGGVCSGIAAYMNVDPAIVRILFAIITFGGFGLGFLAYIILWIVLPPNDLEGYRGKRLYRNPDDKVIGGVAGGLAAYFDKRVSTIRLIFAAPLLLSILFGVLNGFAWNYDFDFALNLGFGSLSGTFFLIYFVLWIVLPEAHSDYEKMEMRGETVDVNRIRQNVREGMGNVKERMQNWSDEVKESAQNFSAKAKEFSNTRGKAFAAEVNETVRRRSNGIGHVIGVIFKVFFLFIAGTIAFAFFVSLMALLFGGVAWWPINGFLWTSNAQQVFAWGTLIFFLIVPLVGFITWIIRRIVRTRSKNSYLGWIFGGLWTIGWIAMILFVSSIVKDFRSYKSADTAIVMNQPVNNKLIVAVSQPELEYTGSFGWMNDGGNGWDLLTDTLKIAAVKFNVKVSLDDQYHVTVKKYSFGRTESEAIDRAEKIQFAVKSTDSVLDVANGYAIDKQSKFRGQNVEIEILVPKGKKIRFDESVDQKLNSIDVKVDRSRRRNRINGIQINTEERRYRYQPGIDYTMGIDGELKRPDGTSVSKYNTITTTTVTNPDGDYRYEQNDSIRKVKQDEEIQRQLNEEKRKREESDKRIKEIEEKLKTSTNKPTVYKLEVTEEQEALVGQPTPGFSLVEWF